jgi:uncharacterized protein YggE
MPVGRIPTDLRHCATLLSKAQQKCLQGARHPRVQRVNAEEKMKFAGIALAVVVLLLLTAGSVTPQESLRSQGSISTTGEAEIRVVPNEVLIVVGMETFDKVLKTAKAENEAAIQRGLVAVRAHRVPAENVQTDFIEVNPRYVSNSVTGELDLVGYTVRKSMTVRLTEIKQFESLLTGLLEAGINHIHGVEWRTTELRKHRDQARALAIKAAQDKAQALASEAGRTLGKVTAVYEHGNWAGYRSWWGGNSVMSQNVVSAGAGVPSFSDAVAGQMSVTANIGVTFELQ